VRTTHHRPLRPAPGLSGAGCERDLGLSAGADAAVAGGGRPPVSARLPSGEGGARSARPDQRWVLDQRWQCCRLVGAGGQVDGLPTERAHLPAQKQRTVAARARPFQTRLTPGAEDEVLLDPLLTNGTRIVDLDALEERFLLERLLVELSERLGGPH